ncbi:MAG: hypothetical protein Q9166_003990 [cf. Caloplaca sp. 2 TL-2023]
MYGVEMPLNKVREVTGGSLEELLRDIGGHRKMDPGGEAYLIPYRSPSDDELRLSDRTTINSAVCSGDKDAVDMMTDCFDRTKGKRGVLRNQCNSTRTLDRIRLVASLSDSTIDAIHLPKQTFDKAVFPLHGMGREVREDGDPRGGRRNPRQVPLARGRQHLADGGQEDDPERQVGENPARGVLYEQNRL